MGECVCVCVRACVCECTRFPSLVSVWSRAWPEHIRETMSELEQLRQEAEQLRNQIRVRQYVVCTCLFMLLFACVYIACVASVCSLHAVTHVISDETVTHVTFVRQPLPFCDLVHKYQLLLCDCYLFMHLLFYLVVV